jgi:hypothetical protein
MTTRPTTQVMAVYTSFTMFSQTIHSLAGVHFDITNWPTNSDQAADALMEMENTHTVNPLMAYGLNKQLIHPKDYAVKLRDALVEMRFNLKHWAIGGTKKKAPTDTFVADIVSIRVIEEPKPRPSPSKKRPRAKDPFDDSDEDTPRKKLIPYNDNHNPATIASGSRSTNNKLGDVFSDATTEVTLGTNTTLLLIPNLSPRTIRIISKMMPDSIDTR